MKTAINSPELDLIFGLTRIAELTTVASAFVISSPISLGASSAEVPPCSISEQRRTTMLFDEESTSGVENSPCFKANALFRKFSFVSAPLNSEIPSKAEWPMIDVLL